MNKLYLSLTYLLTFIFFMACSSDMKVLTTSQNDDVNENNNNSPLSIEEIVQETDSLIELSLTTYNIITGITHGTRVKLTNIESLNKDILSFGLKYASRSTSKKSNFANGQITTTDLEKSTTDFETSDINTERKRFGIKSRSNNLKCFVFEDYNSQTYIIMNLKHTYQNIMNELAIKVPFDNENPAKILNFKNTNYLNQTRNIKQSASELNAKIDIETEEIEFFLKEGENHRYISAKINSYDYSNVNGTNILTKLNLNLGCYVNLDRYVSLNLVSQEELEKRLEQNKERQKNISPRIINHPVY